MTLPAIFAGRPGPAAEAARSVFVGARLSTAWAAFHRACARVPTKEVVAIFALMAGWLFMNVAATAFWLKKVLYATTGLALTVFSLVTVDWQPRPESSARSASSHCWTSSTKPFHRSPAPLLRHLHRRCLWARIERSLSRGAREERAANITDVDAVEALCEVMLAPTQLTQL